MPKVIQKEKESVADVGLEASMCPIVTLVSSPGVERVYIRVLAEKGEERAERMKQ